MSGIYSTRRQLQEIADILCKYLRLPLSDENIPGSLMEGVLAYVRGAERLKTYDFVDVVDKKNKIGWQVKATKAATPVTWKRAKIPNREQLIAKSRQSPEGLQALGNAIIEFCNAHARASLETYNLEQIGFARLVVFPDRTVRYFERILITRANPLLFDPHDFTWVWSAAKKASKKEQLPALHGIHKATGKKWWAWHGLGENQLHFSGESTWWPPSDSPHAVTFALPTGTEKLSFEEFASLLSDVPAAT